MSYGDQITFFGRTNFRGKETPFGIKLDDRRRHMYLLGKTGVGKTTLMETMLIQDVRNGYGACFIDPNGDSVYKVLDYIPANRVNDVIYFNPADLEFPLAFNILETVDPKFKHLVASGLMGIFTKLWAGVWSARMEYILNNTVLALLDSPGNTMLGIARMYVDKKYRKKIVDSIKDPVVRSFWVDEYANYTDKLRSEAVAPIQNKVGQFLSSSVIRNIVGQPKSTLDLREIMDSGKILLVDLSKGKVGEDNSALLGAMIITKLQLAALSRADIDESERKDFFLYVDEFQNFVTDSIATILSEARKYRLNLTIGHQFIGQLAPDRNNTKVKDAVFGNVGTMGIFRIGAADAEFLETEFAPNFTPQDMINLPRFNFVCKLMINAMTSEPFTATGLPAPDAWRTGNREKVIRVSRERFANPVKQVEEKIMRWMGSDLHEQTAVLIGADDDDEVTPTLRVDPTADEKRKLASLIPAEDEEVEEVDNTIEEPVITQPKERHANIETPTLSDTLQPEQPTENSHAMEEYTEQPPHTVRSSSAAGIENVISQHETDNSAEPAAGQPLQVIPMSNPPRYQDREVSREEYFNLLNQPSSIHYTTHRPGVQLHYAENTHPRVEQVKSQVLQWDDDTATGTQPKEKAKTHSAQSSPDGTHTSFISRDRGAHDKEKGKVKPKTDHHSQERNKMRKPNTTHPRQGQPPFKDKRQNKKNTPHKQKSSHPIWENVAGTSKSGSDDTLSQLLDKAFNKTHE